MVKLDKWIYDNYKRGYNEVLIILGNCFWYFKKLSFIALSKLILKLNSKDKSVSLNKDSLLSLINSIIKELSKTTSRIILRNFIPQSIAILNKLYSKNAN